MTESLDLEVIFQSVQRVMEQNRLAFNQADAVNGNHGDHMVDIFGVASQAAREKAGASLSEAMGYAAELLRGMLANGSAQVYALGLAQLAEQLRKYNLDLDDLLPYMRKVMEREPIGVKSARSGDILKAFIAALAGWQQGTDDPGKASNSLGLSYMFDLGVTYMQAKQRNATRAEVIADAATSVSPLKDKHHRYESGKLAILTLLQAMAE
jgi:hypothetical protein